MIVSTDIAEIADVALAYGAEVPFLRPSDLAGDETPDLPVFQHALDWLREHDGYEPDVVVQLRPTSPLRPHGLVDEAVGRLLDHADADSVRCVTIPNQNPFKMWRRESDGWLAPLLTLDGIGEPYNAPRQALPPVFWQTGHVDALRCDTLRRNRSLTGRRILPVVVARQYAIDIDTEADWTHAEQLLAEGGLDLVIPRDVSPRAVLEP